MRFVFSRNAYGGVPKEREEPAMFVSVLFCVCSSACTAYLDNSTYAEKVAAPKRAR